MWRAQPLTLTTLLSRDDVSQLNMTAMKRFRKIMLIAAAICSLAATGQKTIVQRECWLDGNIAASQTMTEGTMSIDISSLSPGLHTFAMRVQDSEGLWSSSVTRLLFVPEASSGTLVNYQYWLDNDIQHAVIVPSSANHGVFSIDISSLSEGMHSLAIRVQNTDGKWSSSVTRFFLKPVAPCEATIVRCKYWFDDDVQHAVTALLDGNNGVIGLDVSQLTAGEHTLSWTVGDDKGAWSEITTEVFIAPGPPGDVNCDGGVDIRDVTELIDYLLGIISTTPVGSDVNYDGHIDITDLTDLIDILLTGG